MKGCEWGGEGNIGRIIHIIGGNVQYVQAWETAESATGDVYFSLWMVMLQSLADHCHLGCMENQLISCSRVLADVDATRSF